jgi:predicted SnoaL-like aldol condensation-catalyzing enzyme
MYEYIKLTESITDSYIQNNPRTTATRKPSSAYFQSIFNINEKLDIFLF